MNSVKPTEIRLKKDKSVLVLSYADAGTADLSAEYLRTHAPSADVQGHTPEEKKTVFGKKDVLISGVEPVGHYAIRIRFSDGHGTGIYTWPYLRELIETEDEKWAAYLAELNEKGFSRQ